MRSHRRTPWPAAFAVVFGTTSLVAGISPESAAAGTTRIVSSPPVYDPVNHQGARPSISADGRYVAFETSNALVPDDIPDVIQDIYVKDLQTEAIARVSVSTGGDPANGHCRRAAISPDGRFVAFDSFASNLVAGDMNGTADVFVHDRVTGITERVSVDGGGIEGNGFSYDAVLSEDGRFVAFTSESTNFVAGHVNSEEVYLRDRQNGTTEIVSVSSDEIRGHDRSFRPAISYDGRYVAFTSGAGNFDPFDVNGLSDVFVRDRQAGTTIRASVDGAGHDGDFGYTETISADGRYVAFHGGAHLVAGDTNGTSDVFVKDMQTGSIERLSVSSVGDESDGYSVDATISGNGRFVAFSSGATNLAFGDTNGFQDVFVHDRETHTTEMVSVGLGGTPGDLDSGGGTGVRAISLTFDGHLVAFDSSARNLVENDLNHSTDVFARGINQSPSADCVARATSGGGASGHDITVECAGPLGREVTLDAALSSDPDGDALTFHWDVSDLDVVLGDENAAITSGFFPVGVTMATVTVADGRGGVDTCDLIVRVQDTHPPDVECTTSVAALWPPRHDMVAVTITVRATDECSAPESVIPVALTIRSDEPDDATGAGDGHTTGDVNGADGYTSPVDVSSFLLPGAEPGSWTLVVLLRAEREGAGDGRKYTIDVSATDASMNAATTSCCVVVPHDRRATP